MFVVGGMEVWVNNCRFFELAPGGGKEVEGPGFELPGVESLHLQVQAACHHASVGPTAPRDGRGRRAWWGSSCGDTTPGCYEANDMDLFSVMKEG